MPGPPREPSRPGRPRIRRLLGLSWPCALVVAGCADEPGVGGPPATAEERLARWEAENPDAPARAALGFGRPVPDSALVSLLGRHRLRPYAVHLAAGGMASEQRVPPNEASLELVARSREEAMGQLRVALCAQPNRARVMLEDSPMLLQEERGSQRVSAILTYVDLVQADLRELATGAPIFYGVEVVGAPADLRAALDEPLLSSLEPGAWSVIEGERRIVVPEPELEPGWIDPEIAPEYTAMDADMLAERFRALADGIEGCDEVEPLAR